MTVADQIWTLLLKLMHVARHTTFCRAVGMADATPPPPPTDPPVLQAISIGIGSGQQQCRSTRSSSHIILNGIASSALFSTSCFGDIPALLGVCLIALTGWRRAACR